MKRALLLTALLALLATGGPARSEGEVKLGDLRLGTYWYGAQIDKKDLLGKVVLVEIWGS
jgi:hypothetical protein